MAHRERTEALVLAAMFSLGSAAAWAQDYSGRESLPASQFLLGGAIPSAVFADRQPVFPGLRPQERVGRAVQLLQMGLQHELADQVYVTVKGHVGNTADTWRLGFDGYRQGYELAIGARTFLGPLELVGSGSSGRPSVQVRLGHVF